MPSYLVVGNNKYRSESGNEKGEGSE
jgi:hypothetical protein